MYQFSRRRGGLYRSWLAGAALPGVLVAIGPSMGGAQGARVGRLDGVRGIEAGASCDREYVLKGSRESISIVRGAAAIKAWPTDSAVLKDRLRVGRNTDLRFHIDRDGYAGNFILTPEFGQCAKAADGLKAVGIESSSGEGSYALSSTTETIGGRAVERLALTVDNGAAVVEWSKGRLSVFALGRELRDSGTVFTVLVDSARNRAMVYVRDGIVTMAGAASLAGPAGRAFVFSRTGPVQQVTLNTAVLQDALYHYRDVWTQAYKPGGFPFWRVAGGVAIIGGGAVAIIHATRDNRKPSGPYNGNIGVKIPL